MMMKTVAVVLAKNGVTMRESASSAKMCQTPSLASSLAATSLPNFLAAPQNRRPTYMTTHQSFPMYASNYWHFKPVWLQLYVYYVYMYTKFAL